MYRLIAIDLDGTLLNQYGVITPRTKQALQKAKDNGMDIIIASGRPMDSVNVLAKEINSDRYFISANGAIIYDFKDEKIIYKNVLKKQKVLDIIRICEENSIYYNIYTEREILSKNLQCNVLYYYKENSNKNEVDRTHINIVDNIYDYVNGRNDEIVKITICETNLSIFKSIMRKIKEIDDIEVLDVSHMSRKVIKQGSDEISIEYYYTEISAKNVDKWKAIEFLKDRLEIKTEEIIAIGDNINDKKMIENSGFGIAMGQSHPDVKKVADYVTKSNVEDGVAEAIQHILEA